MRRAGLLGLTILLSLSATPGTAGATADVASNPDAPGVVAFTPGAPGVGDPYYPLDGNGGYDVASYDLAISYNPATDVLKGSTTIRARATQNLSTFDLDLDGLTVRDITVNGAAASWTRDGGELIVTPDAGLRLGRTFTTVVRYDGVPKTISDPLVGTSGWLHTDDGAVVAGEPEVASTWFPVNDHPRDKASYTIRITVPEGLEAVSNGVPKGRSSRAGLTTWTWSQPEPMASYLATATIGQFDITAYNAGGLPVLDAIDVDLIGTRTGNIAQGSFAREPEIIDFLSSVFGPYPFGAVGGIVDDNQKIGFALENQTRPIYAKGFFTDATSADSVVVHELAHQWYGDSVAVDSWQHIWLNEGFATYAQWLWSEDQGLGTADAIFNSEYSRSPNDPFWDVIVGDPGRLNLFSSPVYDRGAMTLHALRGVIGEADFFTLLPAWAQGHEGGNGTTNEFIALAEQISGQQLDSFFDAWLFTGSKPALS